MRRVVRSVVGSRSSTVCIRSALAVLTLLGAVPAAGLPSRSPDAGSGGSQNPESRHVVESLGVEAHGLLIETISVEGTRRASPELILSESLLEPGRVYSEPELRAAIDRVRRLPFVLDARPSLRKGSHRDAYQLVITVLETRLLFAGVDVELATFGSPLALDDGLTGPSVDLTDHAGEVASAAGVRWFVGSHGVVFAGADSEGARAGYVDYDLLDRHILGSIQLAVGGGVDRIFPLGIDPALGRWSLRDTRQIGVELAVPLSAVRSVRLDLATLDGDRSSRLGILERDLPRFLEGGRIEHRRLSVRWVHDSSDDPVLPTRGETLSAGLSVATLASRQTLVSLEPSSVGAGLFSEPLPRFDSTYVAFEVSATRHFEVTPRQVVSVATGGSLGRSSVRNLLAGDRVLPSEELTAYGASAAVRWSIDLRDPRRIRTAGRDLRWEVQAGYGWEATAPSFDLAGNPLEKVDVRVSLVMRNGWGLFRFGLSFLDAGELLR